MTPEQAFAAICLAAVASDGVVGRDEARSLRIELEFRTPYVGMDEATMAGLFDEPTVAYAQVAVERGVDAFQDGLTYGIPERLSHIQPGHLVTVPLGRGNTPTSAWVLSIHNELASLPKQVKQIYDCNNASIQLPSDLLSLDILTT